MKNYLLNYYPLFKCIADKCKHTCCAGWEININEECLSRYKNDKSPFSTVLKNGINFKKSKFKSDKSKRCAFLNNNNLCDIIINLSENSLCQVCKDHPRFRSFFTTHVETGLGFCCEEVARIILSFTDKIEPILVCDDKNKEKLDFNEQNILEFRKTALDVMQDRTVDINERIDNLLKLCKANIVDSDFKKIIKTFLSFERLDKSWALRLKSISPLLDKTTRESLSHYAEQFLVNGIYRHLSGAEDTMWIRARTIALVVSWWIIKSIIEVEKTKNTDFLSLTIDVIRAFSAEVEYSDKNLSKLFAFCYKFIKI